MVVRRGWLEAFVIECSRFNGEEGRNFEQVQLAVARFGHSVSRNLGLHEIERLLFVMLLCRRRRAIGAILIVARV